MQLDDCLKNWLSLELRFRILIQIRMAVRRISWITDGIMGMTMMTSHSRRSFCPSLKVHSYLAQGKQETEGPVSGGAYALFAVVPAAAFLRLVVPSTPLQTAASFFEDLPEQSTEQSSDQPAGQQSLHRKTDKPGS